jgi:hypothetical protein
MAQKFTITYTSDKAQSLEDDFILVNIEAHSYEDAMTIVENIERSFKGVTVTCEEHARKKKRRRSVNSDRRKV